MNSNPLGIIYQDEYLVAINKPNGLLVHRSPIAADASEFALQLVRDMLGKHVYPIHRLDRKTSGVLLFALDSASARAFQQAMENNLTQKRYLAIVRGFFPGEIDLNYPLTNDDGKIQEAETLFRCLKTTEINIPFGKHSTSRYSLVEAFPKTGRMHQIRKHLDHLRHPIIGDRPWGCNKQNKLFLEKWALKNMMLHAESIQIIHPFSNENLILRANLPEEFQRIQNVLNL